MAYKGSHKVHKVMIQPINVIFRHLQNRTRVSLWLTGLSKLKMEGIVIGFDEYMNIVLDDAEEVWMDKKKKIERKKKVGRILFKGDAVTLMHPIIPGLEDASELQACEPPPIIVVEMDTL